MEILAWLWWAISAVFSLLWALVWFLISGWVSTLLQIALLVAVVYYLKYGWQRAPAEIWKRSHSFGRFFWNWVRAREPQTDPRAAVREVVRVVRVKEFGSINVSTLLTLLMLGGFLLLPRV